MYGNIGLTRRDKTPPHWREDYRLKPKAKQLLAQIESERERLFKEFEALPDDISDESYAIAEREIRANLDALIDRADAIRRTNTA
jgi:hypothetical protein